MVQKSPAIQDVAHITPPGNKVEFWHSNFSVLGQDITKLSRDELQILLATRKLEFVRREDHESGYEGFRDLGPRTLADYHTELVGLKVIACGKNHEFPEGPRLYGCPLRGMSLGCGHFESRSRDMGGRPDLNSLDTKIDSVFFTLSSLRVLSQQEKESLEQKYKKRAEITAFVDRAVASYANLIQYERHGHDVTYPEKVRFPSVDSIIHSPESLSYVEIDGNEANIREYARGCEIANGTCLKKEVIDPLIAKFELAMRMFPYRNRIHQIIRPYKIAA